MMELRNPDVEWMKKLLADIERSRGDPQIAALMDDQRGGWAADSREAADAIDADLVPFVRPLHRDY
jgi:hypothetical protein